MMKVILLCAVIGLAAATGASAMCSGMMRNTCLSLSECEWCVSHQFPAGCFTPQQAKFLPHTYSCVHGKAAEGWNLAALQSLPTSNLRGVVEAEPEFTPCGGTLSISSVDVSPNPPQKGKKLTVTVKGNIASGFTDATLKYTISVIGIPVVTRTVDVCSDISCPVSAGPLTFSLSEDIPAAVPDGEYTLKATVTSSDNVLVACFTETLTVG